MAPQVDTLPAPTNSSLSRSRASRRARLLGSLLALLALGGTGWLAWHLTRPEAPQGATAGASAAGGRRGAPPTTVGVASAETTRIPIVLEALGTVTPQASVNVRPQVSGVLQKVLFQEGQMVRAGDVLATIDPRPFELALMQASGQRQQGQAQLASARVTLARFQTLLAQDSIARQEVDSQAALVKQLEGAALINQANEGLARLNLGHARVLAPISGRVGLRSVDVGNVVSSSDAGGIALITQLSPVDVVFAVPQDRAGELQQAAAAGTVMPASALDRTRSDVLASGVFASLDNQVDVQTGTVRAKARFANRDLALFPSQFVNVRLQLRTIEQAVTVPVAALRHGSSGDFVYVLNAAGRTVSLRPVERGQATADRIQIVSGLQAGEQVITEGADRLKDGAPVVLPGAAPRGVNDANGTAAGGGRRQRPDAAAEDTRPAASAGAPAPTAAPPADAASPARRPRASQAEGL